MVSRSVGFSTKVSTWGRRGLERRGPKEPLNQLRQRGEGAMHGLQRAEPGTAEPAVGTVGAEEPGWTHSWERGETLTWSVAEVPRVPRSHRDSSSPLTDSATTESWGGPGSPLQCFHSGREVAVDSTRSHITACDIPPEGSATQRLPGLYSSSASCRHGGEPGT